MCWIYLIDQLSIPFQGMHISDCIPKLHRQNTNQLALPILAEYHKKRIKFLKIVVTYGIAIMIVTLYSLGCESGPCCILCYN